MVLPRSLSVGNCPNRYWVEKKKKKKGKELYSAFNLMQQFNEMWNEAS